MNLKHALRGMEAFLVGIVCGAAPAARAADLPACPSDLTVRQTVEGDLPGWQALGTNDKHPYVGVAFTEGPPDRRAILAPTRTKRIGGSMVATWSLATSAAGYWVSCLYGETSATLSVKLPSDTATCEVEYDNRFSAPVAKQWRCGPDPKPR